MLLVMTSVLINHKYGIFRKRKNLLNVHETTLEIIKVISIAYYEATVKINMWLFMDS